MIKMKQTRGTEKPKAVLDISEIYPIKTGMIEPPTIDITSMEEAFLVNGPNPLIPRANIVGNIIDIKK